MQKIGIVGFGAVGKSVLRFFERIANKTISVWDKKDIEQLKISLEQFLQKNDQIIVSPGVDVRAYQKYRHKFVSELDLFGSNFTKKTIGITGTLGKTSVTRLISSLLPYKNRAAGNIGLPMLDIIKSQDEVEYGVLELSSFQLDQNKSFAPDVAVWTNFYSNHLDRHSTIKDYFDAKWRLFTHQTKNQRAFFSIDLLFGEYGNWLEACLNSYRGNCSFVSHKSLTKKHLSHPLLQDKNIFFVSKNIFYKIFVHDSRAINKTKLCDLNLLSGERFFQNLLLALAVLDCCEVKDISSILKNQKILTHEHRLELFTTFNSIDFYNDSKATIIQATQAAVEKLSAYNRPIILILGGLGKGVDRTPLIRLLSQTKCIKKVFYLGHNSREFADYDRYSSLSDLVRVIMQTASAGDQVLFSPGGSSFDMFTDYKDRGDRFKKEIVTLVNNL